MLLCVGLLAVGALLGEHGFSVSPDHAFWINVAEVVLAGVYVADRVLLLVRGPSRWGIVRQRQFEFAVLALFLVLAIGLAVPSAGATVVAEFLRHDTPRGLVLHLIKLFLLANVLVQMLRLQQRLLFRGFRPEWMLAGSYAMLILAGTLLLLLPRASALPDRPIGLSDAIFSATSASCVTGLTVRDTGTEFTTFGQGVLLALFQVGGIGIMTFVAFLAVTSAESLPVPQMLAFRKIIGARSPAALRRQLCAIIAFTLLVEAGGAACLYACLPQEQDPLARLGWSVFHSVSAFCNSGFALSPDSLAGFEDHPGALLTFMVLIVLGGLGFLVVMDLLGLRLSRLPLIRSVPWVRRYNQRVPVYRLPIQTRLSVLVSGLLIIAGLLGFWALEAGNVLAGKPLLNQFWIATFQSVTCRSAGLSVVAIDQLHPATLLLVIALMTVGASPVSMGGGIKTVTFAVLLLALRALITGRDRVEIYGRALPQRVLLTALAVVVLYILVGALGLFGLSLCDPQMPLRHQLFEVASALSTTGLSIGAIPQLSVESRLILCLLMFVGRVGPISLVLAMVRIQPPTRYQYPEEDLVVG